MTTSLEREYPRWILAALLFLLAGAISLPMLPIWQGGIRSLAGILILTRLISHPKKQLITGTILAASLTVAVLGWASAFLQNPASHVVHALTDVFGQPIGLQADLTLLVYDFVCIGCLVMASIKRHQHTDTATAIFVVALFLFWLWSSLTIPLHAAKGSSGATLAAMATGLSGWATWLYWGLLITILVETPRQVQLVLRVSGVAGLLVGAVILLQWLTKDFSYLLFSHGEPPDIFSRIRGTDYYHAPASYVTATSALALFGLAATQRPLWPLIGAAFLVGISLLNNTRAVSLSLLAGMIALTLLSILQKRWHIVGTALVAVICIAPSVIYLKPTAVPSQEHAPKTTQEDASKTTMAAITTANAPRTSLAIAGIELLANGWVTGHGAGTLELPLEGNTFNGILSTYSTHTLYLDIALMGGGPALLFLALGLLTAAWVGVERILRGDREAFSLWPIPALVGMLVGFAIVSVFLPQERNEVVAIGFAGAALILRCLPLSSARQPPVVSEDANQEWKSGYVLLVVGVIGWSILTSPAYIFPAIELIGRHGREIVRERQSIYLMEPAMRPLVSAMLRLRGGNDNQVKILEDSDSVRELDQAWVIWNPARQYSYPNLMRIFANPQHLYRNQSLGVAVPENWWLVPSAQPLVSFFFTGGRNDILALTSFVQPKSSQPSSPDEQKLLPNIAPFSEIQISSNISGQPQNVADFNYGSSVHWDTTSHAIVTFRIKSPPLPLRLYRLSALHLRGMKRVRWYSWVLEGSFNETEWILIERRDQEPVSQDTKNPSAFLVYDNRLFTHYRLRFLPTSTNSSLSAGMSEIELYFAPPDNLQASGAIHE